MTHDRGTAATAPAAGPHTQTGNTHEPGVRFARVSRRPTCVAALSCSFLLLGHTQLGAPPADPPTEPQAVEVITSARQLLGQRSPGRALPSQGRARRLQAGDAALQVVHWGRGVRPVSLAP